jgi:hypothetical protein
VVTPFALWPSFGPETMYLRRMFCGHPVLSTELHTMCNSLSNAIWPHSSCLANFPIIRIRKRIITTIIVIIITILMMILIIVIKIIKIIVMIIITRFWSED